MSGLTRKIRTDEKGVSPVIGVILMVAITVILAAVIASFVFGMGSKVQAAPQAQLMAEDNADMIDGSDDILFNVTHYGGDDLKCDEIKLQVLNATVGPHTLVWNGTSNANRFEYKNSSGNVALIANDTVNNAFGDGIFSVGETFGIYEANGAQVFSKSPDTLTFRVIHIPTGNIIYETNVKVQ